MSAIGARDFNGMEVADGTMGTGLGMRFDFGVECSGTCDMGHEHPKTHVATAVLDRREIADLHEMLGEWLDTHGRP